MIYGNSLEIIDLTYNFFFFFFQKEKVGVREFMVDGQNIICISNIAQKSVLKVAVHEFLKLYRIRLSPLVRDI